MMPYSLYIVCPMKTSYRIISAFCFLAIGLGCTKKVAEEPPRELLTQNVIIVVMDGPRYSETWGDSSHQYIPRMAGEFCKSAVINTSFSNSGVTYTTPGHTSLTTGHNQTINNSGGELPARPSVFQHWRKEHAQDSTAAWIIASKDKLEVLANCTDSIWNGQYQPSTNCGVGGFGVGSGYRHDSLTYAAALDIFQAHHPRLTLINFREPDVAGHANNWPGYIQGIKDVDNHIVSLWEFIQADPFYSGTTTMFITNDHGRHLDDVADGFISHGDDCEGCRHIFFFATGPDFKNDVLIDTPRSQIDIAETAAYLMDVDLPGGDGEVMWELFK